MKTKNVMFRVDKKSLYNYKKRIEEIKKCKSKYSLSEHIRILLDNDLKSSISVEF